MDAFSMRLLIENIATIVAITGILGFVALGPIGRALARRIEGKAVDPGGLHELRDRLADLEGVRSHVAELEERLDFAERLLAQRSEPARLGPED